MHLSPNAHMQQIPKVPLAPSSSRGKRNAMQVTRALNLAMISTKMSSELNPLMPVGEL